MTKTKVWIVERDVEEGVLDGHSSKVPGYGWHLAVDEAGDLRILFDDTTRYVFSYADPGGRDHTPVGVVG